MLDSRNRLMTIHNERDAHGATGCSMTSRTDVCLSGTMLPDTMYPLRFVIIKASRHIKARTANTTSRKPTLLVRRPANNAHLYMYVRKARRACKHR